MTLLDKYIIWRRGYTEEVVTEKYWNDYLEWEEVHVTRMNFIRGDVVYQVFVDHKIIFERIMKSDDEKDEVAAKYYMKKAING